MRKQPFLTRMKSPVGSKQNVEVTGKPRCHSVVETHWVLPQERSLDLLLVRGDNCTHDWQVLLYHGASQSLRIALELEPLHLLKPTRAVPESARALNTITNCSRVTKQSLTSIQPCAQLAFSPGA